jgi:hypothetical protein
MVPTTSQGLNLLGNGSSFDPFGVILVIFALLVIAAFCGAILVGVYFIVRHIREETRKDKRGEIALLEITVPKDNEIEINAAEQMFANFYGIGKDSFMDKLTGEYDYISFEIVALPESIKFYVAMPASIQELVENQIHASYADAEIREADQYNIFQDGGHVEYAELQLSKDAYFPIRDYEDLKVDTLSAITNSMSKVKVGEGMAMQVLITPSDGKWKDKGKKHVQNLEKPGSDDHPKPPADSRVVEGINKKIGKLGYFTVIRLLSSSLDPVMAKSNLKNMVGDFSQFTDPSLNKFKKRKLRWWDEKEFIVDFIYRHLPLFPHWPFYTPTILNTSELASVFHLPNKNVQTPHIHWLNAKRASVSENVPTEGLYLGEAVYRGRNRKVCMLDDDRRRHMYIVGRTGTGKSTLLEKMILQDIRAGKGVAFIDPHGQSAKNILYRIPPERAEDVIYFNPGDTERPMGFNVLEWNNDYDKHLIANAFYALLEKLFDPNKVGITGPRLERAVRSALLTAMAKKGNTLIECLRLILLDKAYINEMLKYLDDDIVRKYWTEEIAQTSDYHKSETLGYFASKFDRFVVNKLMRNILGQSESSFDLRKIMDEQKILLIDLDKGTIGQENSQFLGLLLVPKLLQAAYSRTDLSEEERKDFYLYVDEFQNFATSDFMHIMSEARKYRLNLVVANQYITQMTEEVRNAVFGNVGTLVSFKVGADDAEFLEKEFSPAFTKQDLINLENRNAYVKMTVKGETIPAFSVDTTWDIPPANKEIGDSIKQLSRIRYGRDREAVEQEIKKRNEVAPPPAPTQNSMFPPISNY